MWIDTKRHIVTDTDGNLVHAVVHPADVQDRDGAPLVLAGSSAAIPGCDTSSPMAALPATSFAKRCARSGNGRSRSSSDPIKPKASRYCPDAGSLSGPLRGAVANNVLPRTSSRPSPRQLRGCSSHRSSSSLAASQGHEICHDSFDSDCQRVRWGFATKFVCTALGLHLRPRKQMERKPPLCPRQLRP